MMMKVMKVTMMTKNDEKMTKKKNVKKKKMKNLKAIRDFLYMNMNVVRDAGR